MAKERRKNTDSEVKGKTFTEVEKQHIIANFKGVSVTQLARDVGCKEEEIKQFIADLIKVPGAGRSRDAFNKKGGVTVATGVASQRGDNHTKKSGSDYQQFVASIHKPLG